VEPNPASIGCLKLNIERNGLSSVTAMQAAAGSDGGTMHLIYHPGWEMIAYNAEVSAPWFYKQSALARWARWIIAGLTNRHVPADPSAVYHHIADVARTHHGLSWERGGELSEARL
jgi:hypothetical protein